MGVHRLGKTFLDKKWQSSKYGLTWKYGIGACNIFAWKCFIWLGDVSGIFGWILQAMEMGVP